MKTSYPLHYSALKKLVASSKVLICVFIAISCRNDIKSDKILKLFKNLDINIEQSNIKCLIIPLDVCAVCTQKTAAFIKENLGNSEYIFILVPENKKILKITFSDEELSRSNVYVDKIRIAMENEIVYDHTVIYRVSQDFKIKQIGEILPSNLNTIFKELEKY